MYVANWMNGKESPGIMLGQFVRNGLARTTLQNVLAA